MMRPTILFLGGISLVSAFSTSNNWRTNHLETKLCGHGDDDRIEFQNDKSNNHQHKNRRDFLVTSATVATTVGFPFMAKADDEQTTSMLVSSPETAATSNPPPSNLPNGEGVILYQTPSGLKYIKLEPGKEDSGTPRYGQVCILAYTAYLKLPNSKEKEKFDSYDGYVTKHGSGRMIPGLDEGLHTMKIGELRRIIIPPKLGFVTSGLGPLPEYPWNRSKLNRLLDDMVAQRGGNLVYDVRLLNFFDDEADQGYYDDDELSPEDLAEIQARLMKRKPQA